MIAVHDQYKDDPTLINLSSDMQFEIETYVGSHARLTEEVRVSVTRMLKAFAERSGNMPSHGGFHDLMVEVKCVCNDLVYQYLHLLGDAE
ncbi:hypothetical protein [Acetobacter sicerae]|uniref:hypothetical protein n=1 Tax=Acetobacter sicerae TaxID=85325 RepID=UPI00156AD784|nr:hypothetical protein [Acetobacter sicerae]NHN93776.1 hypothetical protein [Acetobacter sicerae]